MVVIDIYDALQKFGVYGTCMTCKNFIWETCNCKTGSGVVGGDMRMWRNCWLIMMGKSNLKCRDYVRIN